VQHRAVFSQDQHNPFFTGRPPHLTLLVNALTGGCFSIPPLCSLKVPLPSRSPVSASLGLHPSECHGISLVCKPGEGGQYRRGRYPEQGILSLFSPHLKSVGRENTGIRRDSSPIRRCLKLQPVSGGSGKSHQSGPIGSGRLPPQAIKQLSLIHKK
jgi:hypothetical protein